MQGTDILLVDDMKKNRNVSDLEDDRLPAFFDARVKWGNICPLIGDVSNQGTCKSGWVSPKYVPNKIIQNIVFRKSVWLFKIYILYNNIVHIFKMLFYR